jgi:hypothetical protein
MGRNLTVAIPDVLRIDENEKNTVHPKGRSPTRCAGRVWDIERRRVSVEDAGREATEPLGRRYREL